MTFIDALNDPELRSEIDLIEDIWSSLDHGDRDEPELHRILGNACAAFKAKTGLDIDPRSF